MEEEEAVAVAVEGMEDTSHTKIVQSFCGSPNATVSFNEYITLIIVQFKTKLITYYCMYLGNENRCDSTY